MTDIETSEGYRRFFVKDGDASLTNTGCIWPVRKKIRPIPIKTTLSKKSIEKLNFLSDETGLKVNDLIDRIVGEFDA